MSRILRFLLMGIGLPIMAREIRNQSHDFSKKLMLVEFLNQNKKSILRIYVFGMIGMILVSSGLTMALFSIALKYDLGNVGNLNATLGLSISILLIGLICGGYAWRKTDKLEKEFQFESLYRERKSSLSKVLFESVLNGITPKSEILKQH